MRPWRARQLLLLILALASGVLSANAPESLHALSLPRIDQARGERVSLSDYAGRTLLVLLFEDECHYCLQALQVADARVHAEPDRYAMVAVGVGASARALNAWAQRVHPHAPVLQATGPLLASLGGVRATPLLLIVDASGTVRLRELGSFKENDLDAWLLASAAR